MTAVANSWRSYPCSMARLEIELRNYNDSSTKGAQRSHCKIFMEAKKAGMKANPTPDLKPNKVPVAKLDAVKGALAIPDIVLAQRLGVTRQTLSAWRSAGEIPTMAALALEGLLPAQPVAIVCTLATNIEQLKRLRTFLKNEKMAFRSFRL